MMVIFTLFAGNALLRRLVRIGVLDEGRMKLDYVLGLKIEDFLERRLQTQVFKLGLAKSIHHARVLIRQRHIRYSFDWTKRPVQAKSTLIGFLRDDGTTQPDVRCCNRRTINVLKGHLSYCLQCSTPPVIID